MRPDSGLSPASSHVTFPRSVHTGLFSLPQILHAPDCLKAFTIAVSSAWNPHRPFLFEWLVLILQISAPDSFAQTAFSDHPTQKVVLDSYSLTVSLVYSPLGTFHKQLLHVCIYLLSCSHFTLTPSTASET